MSGEPLTNTAIEKLRAGIQEFNGNDQPPPPDEWPFTADSWFEDLRPGSPMHGFGRLGRAELIEATAALWDLGSGRPQRSVGDVVAVSGDACAASVESIDSGDGIVLTHINCVMLDETLQLVSRMARFDVDARDDATALVEQWHSENAG